MEEEEKSGGAAAERKKHVIREGNLSVLRRKEETSGLPEMLNHLPELRHWNVKVRGEAGETEKLRRSAMNDFACQGNFVL